MKTYSVFTSVLALFFLASCSNVVDEFVDAKKQQSQYIYDFADQYLDHIDDLSETIPFKEKISREARTDLKAHQFWSYEPYLKEIEAYSEVRDDWKDVDGELSQKGLESIDNFRFSKEYHQMERMSRETNELRNDVMNALSDYMSITKNVDYNSRETSSEKDREEARDKVKDVLEQLDDHISEL